MVLVVVLALVNVSATVLMAGRWASITNGMLELERNIHDRSIETITWDQLGSTRGVDAIQKWHSACKVDMTPWVWSRLGRAPRRSWSGVGVIVTSGRERPGPDDLSDKVAFLAKPYLPETIINVIRHMATPQVIETPSSMTG
jgi:hypothetical protein